MAPTKQHFVIDGSNLATEGRTTPSLAQLQEAVKAFRTEYPSGSMTVVVDASFPHRIDESEHAAFERAEAGGELVSPPAGAIGRGDGFLLQIADRTGATVVSNDSFQEFHAEYAWLFDVSRLIGGKPVPGVGWIFSLRSPVRGPTSRRATRNRDDKAEDGAKPPKPTQPPKKVTAAIAAATADALSPRRRRPRRRKGPSPEAVNDPAPFLRFLIDHRLGAEVDGTVDEFASHGAFVASGGVRAYIPLSAMGEPPPTRARDVLEKGETRRFVVQAVDAPRRAIELALPQFAHPAAAPSDETVEAVTTPAERPARRSSPARRTSTEKTTKKRTTKKKTTTRTAKKTVTGATRTAKAAPKSTTPKKTTKTTGVRPPGAKKKTARATQAKEATGSTRRTTPRKKTATRAAPVNKTTKKTPARKTTTKPSAKKTRGAR